MSSTLTIEANSMPTDQLNFDLEDDLVEEMRMRTWARHNYASPADRNSQWHPIILNEMSRMDNDLLMRS